jgi:hypothetical protein
VDWLIHELIHDVIMKYVYNQYLKEHGSISNKKAEHLVFNSVLQSLKILNSYVSLPTEAGQPTLVTLSKRPHVKYAVYNPDTQWACCTCVHAPKGNLCEYQIKVLRMMKSELADKTIVKVCRTLYRTRPGGVSILCRPVSPPEDSLRHLSNTSKVGVNGGSLEYVQLDSSQGDKWMESTETLDARIAELGRRIIDHASRHFIIKRHLIIDLQKMDTNTHKLRSK